MELQALRDELKSAMAMNGGLFVKIFGLQMMQMWCVGSLDSIVLVSCNIKNYKHLAVHGLLIKVKFITEQHHT